MPRPKKDYVLFNMRVDRTEASQCLIQLDGGDGLYFLSNYGERTPNLQEARIFREELSAHFYIDKHGLNRLAKVRKIIKEA